jgi:coniferyl-aldehyde dehydrogenase
MYQNDLTDKLNDSVLINILRQQKECFHEDSFPSYEKRIRVLTSLYYMLIKHQDALCEAINQDFGTRPVYETKVLEIFPSLELIKYNIKHLKKWMRPRKHKTSVWFWPSKCWVMPQPLGVIGIISPWNYPLLLTIAPLAAALAAGNRVMLKTSEHTPRFSTLIKQLLSELFMSNKLVIIEGDATVGAQFSRLEFDHLFFTGSTCVGKKVYSAASVNLTPVTLELGGKSPAILFEKEINLEFVERVWLSKIINAGQTCIAPDYIWLPQGSSEHLLALSQKIMATRFTDLKSLNYCSIINKTNYDRIISLVADAISKGAKWVPFHEPWHSADNDNYRIAPGLLLNVNHTMQVMQEEIFGPIMPVMEYEEFDHIIKIMKLIPKPLVIYLFSYQEQKQQQFITDTISGALCINNAIVHAAQESLPFGGVGESGMGRYRGQYGFDTFSMLKPIFKQSKIDIFTKFYPPITSWRKYLLNFMLK